ncbi:LytTR family DNA-binding domain-containing protein [Chryseolinea sp. T2]|uniref:LytR/AlgR family response regulator transcription factor n=1 Tax=Chryseolinea sp. T2 TaxID=3129255 RepID=UPI0030785E08
MKRSDLMLRAIIVDDELKSRESLKKMISTFCEGVDVLSLCQNVAEAKEACSQLKPDVVFLDVRMQGETGFDLLDQLGTVDFKIIFTTAFSEYALKAIKLSAIDYLLKPIDADELLEAVEKAKLQKNNNALDRIQQLLQNTKVSGSEKFKMALPTAEGLSFVEVRDIIYLKASGAYTEIFLNSGQKHLVSRHLKEYDETLSEQNFFRIHHSILVNIDLISSYVRGNGGYVVMTDGSTLDVSRRRKEAFLQRIGYKD